MLKIMFAIVLISIILILPAYSTDNSLILYLPFDDGEGKIVKDSSDNKNNGEIFGDTKWVNGKTGKSIEFTSGSYVEIKEIPAYDISEAISLMAWVNTTTVTTWARIIDKSQWQDNGFDLALSQATHAPLFEFFVNNTTSQALANTKVDDGKWHFIAGTFGSKNLKIYVDGVMEATVVSAGNVDIKLNDLPIRMCVEANPSKGQPYVGMIDEVAIFNRELSANDIDNIYKNGISVSSSIESGSKLASAWGMLKKF
jgi:hypothetical protein